LPGVAFTQSGGRLGHGMGYYDKFLARLSQLNSNQKTILLALAFKEQIVDENDLPLDEHDQKVDVVVTSD